jgi:hypothetical protein
VRSSDREDSNDPEHGVPEIHLKGKTVPMGNYLAMIAAGSMFGPPIATGALAAIGLGDPIRNTLSEH